MNDLLHIEVEREAATARIGLSGEIDRSVASRLRDTLRRVLEDSDVRQVVVDLRRISFIDASGLAAISGADAASRREGLDFAVIRAEPNLDRLFVLSRVHQQLVMVDEPGELPPPS